MAGNNVIEVQITGNNSDLKKSLQDSRAELKKFAEEIKKSGGNSGIDALKKELNDARIAAVKFSADVKASLAESLNNAKKNTEGAKQATESYKQSLLDAKKAVDAQRAATESARTATEQERAATERQRTALAESRAELARLTLEKRKSQQATVAASGSYREAQQRLTALGKSIREAAGGFTNTSPAIRKQIQEYNQLNNKLKEFDKTMGNHQRNVGNYGSAFAGAIPYIGQFTSAIGALGGVVMASEKSFSYNMKLDAFKTVLKEVSGDSAQFDKNLQFLRETSERLGLDFLTTGNAFKQWQGSARFSNLTADESRRIFESVANAAGKMKLSNDQLNGTFVALSQMMSKGNVQAEELRGQLGERLPGAFSLAAKAMGVTERELNKMLEKGEVLAMDLLPKLATELDNTFGNDKSKQIQSMQAEVTRLSNEWNNLFESKRATEFFTSVSKGLATMLGDINDLMNSSSAKEFWGLFFDRDYNVKRQSNLQGMGFDQMNSNEQLKKIDQQRKYVQDIAKYNGTNSVIYKTQLGILTQMNEVFGKQFQASKQVNEIITPDKGNKPKGKSQADIIKEANEALRGGQIGNLKGIDSELEKIDKKWDGILEKVNKVTNEGLKNQLKAQVEQGRELDKQLAKLDIWSKGAKLKPIGVAAGTVTPTFSSIPSIAPLQNSFAGWTASLSKGLEKDDRLENSISRIIERGFRQGIGGILDNITELGSDFQSVFTNVFGQLRNTLQGVFNDIVGTRLGDLFKSNFDDIDLGGLGNKVSQALVAGAGLAGQLISGMSSQTSALGQGLGGAISGAAMGTAILPGIGTAIGAVLGGISGIFSASKAREEERKQQELLEESKKQTLLQQRIASLSYTSGIVGSRTNLGTVTGFDRDAFGNIEGIVDGKNLKLIIERN